MTFGMFFLLLLNSSFAGSVTLSEAYLKALELSQPIALQNESIRQLEERQIQVKSQFLPVVYGSIHYLNQAVPSSAEASAIYPPSQTTTQVMLAQPLFSGFRSVGSLNQGKQLLEAGRLTQESLKIQLYQDLVQIFCRILSSEQDLVNLRNEMSLHQKRLAELRNLTVLGRSRKAEIISTQSNAAAVESRIEATRGLLASNQTTFRFLPRLF